MTGSIPEDRTTASAELQEIAELFLYDGDTDQPLNDGYERLHAVARRLAAVERERDELRAKNERLARSMEYWHNRGTDLIDRLYSRIAERDKARDEARSQLAEAKSDQKRWEVLWKKAANGVLGLQGENEQLRARLEAVEALCDMAESSSTGWIPGTLPHVAPQTVVRTVDLRAALSVAPQPQPAIACGNCGEPYPGQHIIENEYGNRVVICPRHTAYGTTSVVHDGFIAQCDACAAFSGSEER